MRPDAAREQRIARVEQVLRRDGRADVRGGRGNELGGFPGRDVLEHDLQCRKIAQDRRQHALDEYPLTIEDIDLARGHFPMDQERQSMFLHRVEHRIHTLDCGDA